MTWPNKTVYVVSMRCMSNFIFVSADLVAATVLSVCHIIH